MRIIVIFSLIIGWSLSYGQSLTLQNGDILFRQHTKKGLSEAINAVTQKESKSNFSHMGVVMLDQDQIQVLHSAPKKGVVKEDLDHFFEIDSQSIARVMVFRLKSEYQYCISDAVNRASLFIGEPYNFTYIMEDDGQYCSEFVYRLFQPFSIFTLEPMNFKDPKTGEIPMAWLQHYDSLGISVPEGKLGCNPNGMSLSDKLITIGELTMEGRIISNEK